MDDQEKNTPDRDGGDLEGLRADARDELEQEEAGRRADASDRAYATARASRLSFEAHLKDQAKADAAEDLARRQRDEAAQESYQAVLETEADAKAQADEDARAAGRPTADEQAAADEGSAENGEPVNTGGAYPVRSANEDEPAGTTPEGTTGAAGGEGTWPAGEPDETTAGSAGTEQVTQLPEGEYATGDDAEPMRFEGTARVSRQGDGDGYAED